MLGPTTNVIECDMLSQMHIYGFSSVSINLYVQLYHILHYLDLHDPICTKVHLIHLISCDSCYIRCTNVIIGLCFSSIFHDALLRYVVGGVV